MYFEICLRYVLNSSNLKIDVASEYPPSCVISETNLFSFLTCIYRCNEKVGTTGSKLFRSFLVLALVIMVDQTEGWRRRRRRRCQVTNCAVSSWTSWNTCSQPCGNGGIQRRTRTVTRWASCGGRSCPAIAETRACNRGCSNRGTPLTGRCICKTGYSGRCCTGGKYILQ